VFDAGFNLVSHGRAPTPWSHTELDPDALLAAAITAIDLALGGRRVQAVGVASMAETGVLTDDALRPVVPSIAWWDERGEGEAAELAALPDFSARTGLPPTSMCTLAKYGWMRRNWPDAKHGTRWLNVAEWIVLGLGGEPRPVASRASRTGFYDLHTGQAWAPAMRWADAPASLARPHVVAGTGCGVTRDGARLAIGGHDHAAAAVGAGAAGEGDVLDSCGTAEAILRATGPLDPETVRRAVADGFTVGRHAVPGRCVLQGATWSGEKLQAVIDGYGDDSREYRDALEEVGAAGADILARMAALAGPYRRLVITGGWSDRPEVREMKARHLGAFEHVAEGYAGCLGAARAASRGS
jgi:sugar (pentulose or hexulose) kinase